MFFSLFLMITGLLSDEFPLPKHSDKRLPNIMIKHLLQHSGNCIDKIQKSPLFNKIKSGKIQLIV